MPKLVYASDLERYDIRFSKPYLSKLIASGKFPAPRKCGQSKQSRNAWLESEIIEYRNAIIARRSATA
jgi:predicted DNA-binding transcriptional regulator AlpA